MGIITRQGAKHAIVNYAGAAIGLFSTLFIYPLQPEAYGLAQFLMAAAVLFIPLSVLGAQSLPIRFFPDMEDRNNGNHGFITLLLLLCLVGGLFATAITWIGWQEIVDYYGKVSPLYPPYLIFFLPILILRGTIQVVSSYISNFHRIVVPSILNDLLIKITLPVFVLLVYSGWWTYRELVIGLVVHFVIVLIGLILYLQGLGHWTWKIDWRAFQGPLVKRMGEYAAYGVLGSMGAAVAMNLDVVMIGSMISPEATGIYAIAAVMANLINRPLIAITAISGPILMKAWRKGDRAELQSIYRKSSINSLIPGILLFLLVVMNLTDLYSLMPNSALIRENQSALILLGLAYLINLATGVNAEMMTYSDLYKWHFYAVLIMALLNFIFNLVFIDRMGLTGAALATLISYFIYNLIKGGLVWVRYRMHPFSNQIFWLILLGFVTALVTWIPGTGKPFLDIPLRSALILLAFTLGILYLPISLEGRLFIQNQWGTLLKKNVMEKKK